MEKQIAGKFVSDGPEINIQLFTPPFTYRYNHAGERITGFDSLNSAQQDSALFADSRYVNRVDDSVFLTKYINAFIAELRKLKFNVYLDSSLDSLLAGKPQSYVLNMAQVQLDEYLYPLEESEEAFDSVYTFFFELNAVDAATWFELSKLNSPKSRKTVLYSAFTAMDSFQGNFIIDPFAEQPVRYHSKYDTLTVVDLYDMASFMGRKNASYLYDFFLNQYIQYHLPEDVQAQGYFHFNRNEKRVVSAGDDERFEILDVK